MSLAKYKQKRDFTISAEPHGGKAKHTSKLAFVVQRHKASQLHYDFRLEMNGVLKSWAVPRGPSLNPKDKRLAMMVEDHPYEYKDFEGEIPQGYGAGIVEIWDEGTYNAVDEQNKILDEKKSKAALKAGNLRFILEGKKLKGEFTLVKFKNPGKGNEWLLIKHRDEYAVDRDYNSENETLKNSPVNKWLAENGGSKNALKNPAPKKTGPKTKWTKQTGKENEENIKLGKITLKVTNSSKLYWPEKGITKGMLIDYYQSVAHYILPFLKDRPQSLKRNPNGIMDKGFFHKDAGGEAPSFVKTFSFHSTSTNRETDYIVCNDKATLAYLNNLGCIELNPWHSTIKKPGKPDYLVIDIDPSARNTFDQVIEVANAFKKVLDEAGAKSYCKTSGATGIHIYLPMGKKYDYEKVKNFSQQLCMIVCSILPGLTTMERNLKKRGNKKIYLDHLQNSIGQTISSVYSARPVKEATVSMPLQWKEVKKGLKPSDFTIYNAIKRIQKRPAFFKGILGSGTNIDACLRKLQSCYGENTPL